MNGKRAKALRHLAKQLAVQAKQQLPDLVYEQHRRISSTCVVSAACLRGIYLGVKRLDTRHKRGLDSTPYKGGVRRAARAIPKVSSGVGAAQPSPSAPFMDVGLS